MTITPFSKSWFWGGKIFLVQSAAQKWSSFQKWLSRCTDHSGKRWAISIFPFKMIQRGDHWMIFSQFRAGWNSTILLVFFTFFITSSPLSRIFQAHKIVLFDPVHVLCQLIQHLDIKSFKTQHQVRKNWLRILLLFHWLCSCSCLKFEGRRGKFFFHFSFSRNFSKYNGKGNPEEISFC